MRDSRLGIAALVAILACALLPACAAPPVDNSAQAREGIEKTNAEWMKQVEAKNAAGVAALYTDDARVLPPNAPPVEGTAAIEQMYAGLVSQGVGRIQLDTVEVEGHGDTAHEQGTYAMFDAAGTKIDEGKAIVIWKKVGDTWKLHRDMFSSNLPPPPPAPAPDTAGTPAAGGEPAAAAAPTKAP